jgi:hypothetical protein
MQKHLVRSFKRIKIIIFLFLLEMIGANREVTKDWAEFESYATNFYARSIVNNQPSSTPTKSGSEQQSSSDITNNNVQLQSNTTYSDLKAITDDVVSVKKAILDLRTYSEEVRMNINSRIISSFCFVIKR